MRQPWLKGAAPLAALALITSAGAEDFFGEVETDTQAAPVDDNPVHWLGWVQQKAGYGYRSPESGASRDRADLTRFETELYGQATADWRGFRLRLAGSLTQGWLPDLAEAGDVPDYAFTDDQADERRWQFQWSDSYLGWQGGPALVRAGYQTLAWGEADTVTVTDVLARRDQRWPGQSELEDLRLPQPALTLNWGGRLDLAVIGHTETDRYPAPYDEFDALAAWRDASVTLDEQDPENPLGYAARWTAQWPGTDLTLMAADVNDTQLSLDSVEVGLVGGQPMVQSLTFQPKRRQVVGVSVQRTFGSWLLKTEQAMHWGVPLRQEDATQPWHDHEQWRSMVAATYSGVSNLSLTGELGAIHTLDWSSDLAMDETRLALSLRARWTTWNDQLDLSAQAMQLAGEQGVITRLEADWQTSDHLSLTATVVDYLAEDEDQTLYPFRNNDAVLLSARWGF